MRKLAIINEDLNGESIAKSVDQKTESLMVSMGMDEPLQETKFGMINPYRTGLTEFLAVEEAKEKEEREAEEAKEAALAKKRQEELEAEAEELEAIKREQEEEKMKAKQGDSEANGAKDEFKFTIGADDDEDEDDDDELDQNSPNKKLKAANDATENAQEIFVDSDDDEDEDEPKIVEEIKVNTSPEEESKDGDNQLTTRDGDDQYEESKQEALAENDGGEEDKEDSGSSPNPYAKHNLSMDKGATIWLRDHELVQTRKEIKNPSALRSMVSQVKEERLLTLKNGVLYSIKRIPSKNIASKSIGRFFAAKIPDSEQDQISQEDRG